MTKRTFASVTETLCSCNYLQDAADNSSNPIQFEPQSSEYQFVYGNCMLVIYHCPFCGGAAPESQRELLFAQIPEAEEERLAKLLFGIETMDDALRLLGKPDFEETSSGRLPERENAPPQIEHHRELRYYHLSDCAEVWLTERRDGQMFWQLQGKHL